MLDDNIDFTRRRGVQDARVHPFILKDENVAHPRHIAPWNFGVAFAEMIWQTLRRFADDLYSRMMAYCVFSSV